CWKIGTLDDPFSYVLLEFIDGVDLGEAKRRTTPEEFDALQCELAELVSALHDNTNSRYMRVMEAPGESFESWPRFYRLVYDSIWHEVEKDPHLSKHCRKQIGRIHERLDRLVAHSDCPRLVHWDI